MQNFLFKDWRPSLSPLVKWSGGKGREIRYFCHHYPKDFDLFIEPFVGGGAVFFDLAFKNNVISDVHEGLVNFYRQISANNALEMYSRISKLDTTEEGYYFVRDKMEIKDEVDRAVRFYYLRKTAFRGMLRYNKDGKFNIPWGRYKNVNFSDLKNEYYVDLLKRTDVRLGSFELIFEEFDSPNNFVFLDPPYDSKFTDYGYCKFGPDYQRKLADIFKSTKNKCLMVIGKTPLIEELYDGYIVETYPKKYSFRLYEGRVGDEINVDHAIIKNYGLDK
jgi:DNA adenine methylase